MKRPPYPPRRHRMNDLGWLAVLAGLVLLTFAFLRLAAKA